MISQISCSLLLTIGSIGFFANGENFSNADCTLSRMDTIINNTLTDQEKSEGWQLLFDGTTTKGWHQYGNKPVGAAWTISDGAIRLDPNGKGGGDIVTDDEFENFDFKLEWNISQNGNSGIMFYVQEDTAKYKTTYTTGPEMQVLDNQGHPDAKIIKHRAGDLYDLISCSKETVKPFGQWNMVEIKAVNGKLDFFLNGENVVSTTMWDDNWRKMLAASKFASMPGFGTFKKGRFALQDHGNEVRYRNIKIRRI